MKALRVLFAGLALASVALAADSADSVVTKARKAGVASHKNVLVVFHASWCGWCHKFDDFMTKSDAGKLVGSSFEVIHLTVLESDNHKADENPGGMDLMKAWKGDKGGIPFMVVLDSKTGKMIMNSNMKNEAEGNMGYPAAPEEIAHFMKMLEKGAPQLAGAKREMIGKWLKDNAPAH